MGRLTGGLSTCRGSRLERCPDSSGGAGGRSWICGAPCPRAVGMARRGRAAPVSPRPQGALGAAAFIIFLLFSGPIVFAQGLGHCSVHLDHVLKDDKGSPEDPRSTLPGRWADGQKRTICQGFGTSGPCYKYRIALYCRCRTRNGWNSKWKLNGNRSHFTRDGRTCSTLFLPSHCWLYS